MSTLLDAPTSPAEAAQPRHYSSSTLADLLHHLGDVAPDRVRMDPPPGQATLDDLIEVNEQRNGPICEWVENTLVEKAMGQHESVLAMIIGGELYQYMKTHDVGMLLGADGTMKILPKIGRAPDISFLSWNSLPGGKPPPRTTKVPEVVPDLVIEIWSEGNKPKERLRKRAEYFRAGVKLVWEIDPTPQTAEVFKSLTDLIQVPVDGILDGGDILPGFSLSLKEVFDRALRRS